MGSFFAEPPDIVERQTLCLSGSEPGMIVQAGQYGFKEELLHLYSPAENNAAEELVNLKDALRRADSESFWPLLTEGLATITDAQYAFVSKRILIDDDHVPVEMPPIGELGSCLMGAAFYVNDGHGIKQQLRNFKYHAYSCPCAYMRHDKIFVIPEKLNDFIVNNPNTLAVPGEAYLGIPLFSEGKCFAHFGVMWSPEGAARRQLGWGYLELLLHSLEDIILERILEGRDFAQSAAPVHQERLRVVPHEAITMAQSLKPYARSLSHELRTPMQGVVGMLDVMMVNVKEAAETSNDPRMREVLATLKENIEMVQDSSRRAVEAADNVVHAYDMNMGVPDSPLSALDKIAGDSFFRRPDAVASTITNIPLEQPHGTKRRRRESIPWRADTIPTSQTRVPRIPRQRNRLSHSEEPPSRRSRSGTSSPQTMEIDSLNKTCSHGACHVSCDADLSASPLFTSEHSIVPGLRHTNIREVIQYVINDALKVGGRPESAIAEETDFGEHIEVRTRTPNGEINTKYIEWIVTPDVPFSILIDEKDLAKTISCVILNAIKFTDNGNITLKAALSEHGRYIVITVKDTGSGIPKDFIPNLFKPFAREDNSITRASEGLGLGLMVAQGLARRLNGDLFCVHSAVSGPTKGSEFELRVPHTPGEVCSRASSPSGSRSPSMKSRPSVDVEMRLFHGSQQQSTPSTPVLSSDPLKSDPMDLVRDDPATSAPLNAAPSLHHLGLPQVSSPPQSVSPARRHRATSKSRRLTSDDLHDRNLASRYPANFLVVEDNQLNRKVLVQMLSKLGYKNVAEAYNGQNAVEQMSKERPPLDQIDIILMDLMMPLVDGFQATETIMKMDLPEPPVVIAVTADATDDAHRRADEVGMKGVLLKPFKLHELEKYIIDSCTKRRISAASSSSLSS